ncbi:acyl-CoA reductase [Gracilimonas sp. BCB1]|uniref:acyl-CoA reductase n=1 Tax=Gracilimonas sp. BCB1 TaxID=3152362 RepID=UPI0032D8D7CA
MSWLKKHIECVRQAADKWLNPENNVLQEAIRKTGDEGLFSRQDIEFQLSVLRENIQNNEIEQWVERAGLSDQKNAKDNKVLCLHAGNLPLVGFQTALGTILSGADYYGKLSRKDPYLLGSFLDGISKAGLDQHIQYTTDLSDFKGLQADKVIFAGSEESVPDVKAKVTDLNATKDEAKYIIRTAKFSIAYLEDWNESINQELVQAMLRYGGKGCRSVAVIVADFGLEEVKEELEEAIRRFWSENPQHLKPAPDVRYQYAYNEAVQRKQLWLKNFLIQESEDLPDTDFTVNWVQGGDEKVSKLKTKFGRKVQSVYTTGKEIAGIETEDLSTAQRPNLWWKPDGVDVIERLIK